MDFYARTNRLPSSSRIPSAATSSITEINPLQVRQLANSSDLALCISADGPMSQMLYAINQWNTFTTAVARCIELASYAVTVADSSKLTQWWSGLWNNNLAPIARETIGIRNDRRLSPDGQEEIHARDLPVRSSWLPPTGGGADDIGNVVTFVDELNNYLVERENTRRNPLGILWGMAYAGACRDCPCSMSTIMLAACRAGLLASRPAQPRDSDYSEQWFESLGTTGDAGNHEEGGTITGVGSNRAG